MPVTEKLKLWAAAFLVLAFIYVLGYADLPAEQKFAASAATLITAVGLVVFSQPGRSFSHFVRDAGNELRKVVWPTKPEIMQMTGIVFVFLTLVTIFLWLVDFIINLLLGGLIG